MRTGSRSQKSKMVKRGRFLMDGILPSLVLISPKISQEYRGVYLVGQDDNERLVGLEKE